MSLMGPFIVMNGILDDGYDGPHDDEREDEEVRQGALMDPDDEGRDEGRRSVTGPSVEVMNGPHNYGHHGPHYDEGEDEEVHNDEGEEVRHGAVRRSHEWNDSRWRLARWARICLTPLLLMSPQQC